MLIQKPLTVVDQTDFHTVHKTQAEQETISTQNRFAQAHTKANKLHNLVCVRQANSEKLELTSA